MKRTIAIFENDYGFLTELTRCHAESDMFSTYVQITEFVEVDFPELSTETIVAKKVAAIDSLIEDAQQKAILRIQELNHTKQELLAISHIN